MLTVFYAWTGWPVSHNFQVFKLEIEHIFLINWFGGPKPLTVDQYLQWKMWVILLKYDSALVFSFWMNKIQILIFLSCYILLLWADPSLSFKFFGYAGTSWRSLRRCMHLGPCGDISDSGFYSRVPFLHTHLPHIMMVYLILRSSVDNIFFLITVKYAKCISVCCKLPRMHVQYGSMHFMFL